MRNQQKDMNSNIISLLEDSKIPNQYGDVSRRNWFTNITISRNPDTVFIFGGNVGHIQNPALGGGGQAAATAGRQNVLPIITTGNYTDSTQVQIYHQKIKNILEEYVQNGGKVVFPTKLATQVDVDLLNREGCNVNIGDEIVNVGTGLAAGNYITGTRAFAQKLFHDMKKVRALSLGSKHNAPINTRLYESIKNQSLKFDWQRGEQHHDNICTSISGQNLHNSFSHLGSNFHVLNQPYGVHRSGISVTQLDKSELEQAKVYCPDNIKNIVSGRFQKNAPLLNIKTLEDQAMFGGVVYYTPNVRSYLRSKSGNDRINIASVAGMNFKGIYDRNYATRTKEHYDALFTNLLNVANLNARDGVAHLILPPVGLGVFVTNDIKDHVKTIWLRSLNNAIQNYSGKNKIVIHGTGIPTPTTTDKIQFFDATGADMQDYAINLQQSKVHGSVIITNAANQNWMFKANNSDAKPGMCYNVEKRWGTTDEYLGKSTTMPEYSVQAFIDNHYNPVVSISKQPIITTPQHRLHTTNTIDIQKTFKKLLQKNSFHKLTTSQIIKVFKNAEKWGSYTGYLKKYSYKRMKELFSNARLNDMRRKEFTHEARQIRNERSTPEQRAFSVAFSKIKDDNGNNLSTSSFFQNFEGNSKQEKTDNMIKFVKSAVQNLRR